jgi:hypothetical protein
MDAEASADYDPVDQVLRISGPGYYLLIAMPAPELASLRDVQGASWEARRTITAGRALDNPVHWCQSTVDPQAISVLVGADDETWALALEFPADVLLNVVRGS